jgi:hypothetical protein
MDKEKLIGRKVRGFRFVTSVVCYNNSMDKYVGQIGWVNCIGDNYCGIKFSDGQSWSYPLSEIEKHLVEEPFFDQITPKQLKSIEHINAIYGMVYMFNRINGIGIGTACDGPRILFEYNGLQTKWLIRDELEAMQHEDFVSNVLNELNRFICRSSD